MCILSRREKLDVYCEELHLEAGKTATATPVLLIAREEGVALALLQQLRIRWLLLQLLLPLLRTTPPRRSRGPNPNGKGQKRASEGKKKNEVVGGGGKREQKPRGPAATGASNAIPPFPARSGVLKPGQKWSRSERSDRQTCCVGPLTLGRSAIKRGTVKTRRTHRGVRWNTQLEAPKHGVYSAGKTGYVKSPTVGRVGETLTRLQRQGPSSAWGVPARP